MVDRHISSCAFFDPWPILLVTQRSGMDVNFGLQAVIIAVASVICQSLLHKPIAELLGEINAQWLKDLFLGALVGSALMLIPALTLRIFDLIRWQRNPAGFSVLSSSLLLFAAVAIAEELLFRGFIFQRLISGLGEWPAQFIVAGFSCSRI
jgi:uncharacterized protein